MHHGIADAAHEIFAIGHLRIHPAGRSENGACAQVTQMGSHGGCPHIDGNAIDVILEARLHPNHFLLIPDRGGDTAVAGGHGCL